MLELRGLLPVLLHEQRRVGPTAGGLRELLLELLGPPLEVHVLHLGALQGRRGAVLGALLALRPGLGGAELLLHGLDLGIGLLVLLGEPLELLLDPLRILDLPLRGVVGQLQRHDLAFELRALVRLPTHTVHAQRLLQHGHHRREALAVPSWSYGLQLRGGLLDLLLELGRHALELRLLGLDLRLEGGRRGVASRRRGEGHAVLWLRRWARLCGGMADGDAILGRAAGALDHGFSPLALGLLLAGGSHDGPWVLGQGAELPHEEGAHREALAVRRVPQLVLHAPKDELRLGKARDTAGAPLQQQLLQAEEPLSHGVARDSEIERPVGKEQAEAAPRRVL
mmetsp:Transcript_26509/g.75277  ORF Transcript_26509/g.75277 Transcript_26509/m.75277 type:complete len:339 (+) Transcript_26509:1393-2409(+)